MTFTKAIGISWGKVAVSHPSLISANRSFGEITTWRLGRARRVSVFGRVGPPRCHVCHDRWPARTLGLDATCGAQTGGVRPPPPGSRAYGVPLRGGASHEAKG